MTNRIKWKRSGAVSKVSNERTGQRFVISTARNPYGVWETAVFETNEMFLPLNLMKPLLVLNASNREQAEEQHIQAAMTFRTKELSDLIPNLQEKASKYRFWSKIQKITLFLFLVLLVMCFTWSWWVLIPALLSLVLNGVAYAKRMKSLRRNPATMDTDEVV